VRGIGVDTMRVTPPRARCRDCGVTQILLPSTLIVRRADSSEVIGTALDVLAEFTIEVAFHATPPKLEQIEKLAHGSVDLTEDQADCRGSGRTLPKPSTRRL